MTVEEMVVEVYEQLGKPTDKRPYADDGETVDLATAGAASLLQWINRGYQRILTWRFRNGRILRFRTTERKLYFSGVEVTDTADAGTTTTITFPAAVSTVADRYKDWVVEITGGTGSGQKRLIVAYSAARVATVHKVWDTVPDATSTFKLTKNFSLYLPDSSAIVADHVPISSVSGIMAVMKVVDLASGMALARADRTQDFTRIELSSGNPSVYQDFDGGLYFNSLVPAGRYYEVRYHGFPAALTELTDEPQIPPQFHEGILLWAVWWGLRRAQEYSGAYSTKKDLEDVMETALQQFDRSTDREEIGLYMGEAYEPTL